MKTKTHPLYPDKVILKSAGGKDRTCRNCARILLWEDCGDSYKAVCACTRVYFEWKPKTEGR